MRKIILAVLCCLTMSLFFPCYSAPANNRIRGSTYQGRSYLFLYDIAGFYGLRIHRSGEVFTLTSGRGHRLVFNVNKRIGSINGINVTYLFAPVLKNGYPYISEMDFRRVLEPALRRVTLPRREVKTIMIDPGHGGKDKGAPGPNGVWEKQIALAISRRLQKALREKGYTVFMTRSGDRYPSLQDRVNMRGGAKADILLSIHCNASAQKNTTGIETFAATPVGAASSSDKKVSFTKFSGNDFDHLNYRLAYEIQRQLITKTKAVDRGVKHARFYVIKNAACPAVLIETGFLSNPREGIILQTAKRQQEITEAIVDGVQRFCYAVKPVKKAEKRNARRR